MDLERRRANKELDLERRRANKIILFGGNDTTACFGTLASCYLMLSLGSIE